MKTVGGHRYKMATTPCNATADCSSAFTCESGLCECDWTKTMGGSHCEDLTGDSIARLAQYFLVMVGHVGVACYVALLLVRATDGLRRARPRGGQCSYVLSTLGCALVGNAFTVASCVFGICDMLSVRIEFDDAVVIETSLDALAAIATVCCFLNVGLFWIEIAVASKRLSLHTSNNLRRTWWVTLGYIALFALGETATLATYLSTGDVEVTNFHQARLGLSSEKKWAGLGSGPQLATTSPPQPQSTAPEGLSWGCPPHQSRLRRRCSRPSGPPTPPHL